MGSAGTKKVPAAGRDFEYSLVPLSAGCRRWHHHRLETKHGLLWPGVRCNGYGLVLNVGFTLGIELRRHETFAPNGNRFLGPIRDCTTTRTLRTLDDQGRFTGILKLIGVLHYVTFIDGSEIVF